MPLERKKPFLVLQDQVVGVHVAQIGQLLPVFLPLVFQSIGLLINREVAVVCRARINAGEILTVVLIVDCQL